jgi:hypothetical protein
MATTIKLEGLAARVFQVLATILTITSTDTT